MRVQSELDKKINALNPGGSVKISGGETCYCTAERSGDGKTLRFVRNYQNGSFEVFHKTTF